MANGFVYFNSETTPGAPRLSGTQGDMVAVMDWIINLPPDPYKWIKEFSGTNIGVYRAQHGDRCYLQIDDNQATTGTASVVTTRVALVRFYDTMSDAVTGTFPVPSDGIVANVGSSAFELYSWCKSDALSTASRAYEGIITSRYLWLVTYADSAALTRGYFHFFGDVAPFEGGHTDYLTLIAGHRGNTSFGVGAPSGANQWYTSDTTGQSGCGSELFSFRGTGNLTGRQRAFFRATQSASLRTPWAIPVNHGLTVYPKSTATVGRRLSLPIPVSDTLSTTNTISANVYPRAILPNLRVLSTSANTGDTFSIGPRQFKTIIIKNTSLVSLCLEITNTDPVYEGF